MRRGAVWVVLGLFLAGAGIEKPDGVDLNDLVHYADAADGALKGPGGCWVVTGNYTWAVRAQGRGMDDGGGRFTRTFRNRRWNDPIGPFDPMVGSAWGVKDATVRQLDRWLEALTGTTETLYTEWDSDRGAVALVRRVALDGAGKEAESRTWVDGAGSVTHQRVTFPKHALGGGLVLKGAGWDVRFARLAKGGVVPAEEFLVFRVLEQGGVVRGHQQIRYDRWEPCSR